VNGVGRGIANAAQVFDGEEDLGRGNKFYVMEIENVDVGSLEAR